MWKYLMILFVRSKESSYDSPRFRGLNQNESYIVHMDSNPAHVIVLVSAAISAFGLLLMVSAIF